MRFLVVYWLIGCTLGGLAWGWHLQRCPKDTKFEPAEAIVFVATWPIVGGMMLTAPHDLPQSACTVP